MTPSTTPSEASSGAPQTARRSLPARLLGVIHSPGPTFAAVAADPRWLGVLVVTLAVSAASGIALMRTDVGRQALVDQAVRSIEAYGNQVSDAQYAQIERMSERAVAFTAVGASVGGVVIVALLSAIVLGVFNVGFDGQASYRQAFAVVAHAGVILTLRSLFATPLNYARESLASPTTLGIFLPMLDEASAPARFLGLIDLFLIWWIVVLAIGVSVLYRRRPRPVAVAFLCIYAAIAMVMAAAMATFGRAS